MHTACTDAHWSQTVLQVKSPPTTAAKHPLEPCSAHRKRNDQKWSWVTSQTWVMSGEKKPGPKGPAMMIKTSMSFCRWKGDSKCMTCRSSKVSVSNTMSSADFKWWKANMIMPTWTRGVVWRSGTYIYIYISLYTCTLWYIMAYDTLWHTHSAGRGATSVCGLSTTPASESSRNAVVIESFQTYAWFIVYNVVPYVIISNILVSNIMVGFPFGIIVIPTGALGYSAIPNSDTSSVSRNWS